MAAKMNVMFVLAVLAAALVHCSVAQRTHVVGGQVGWGIPTGGAIVYTNWASTQSFTLGDMLVFNFQTGNHNVAEVTRASFDACNTSNPISLANNGPANITLRAAGEHFYICTVSQHCNAGQKLAINVSAAPSTPPPSQPPAAAAPQPATPPSSPVPPPTSPAPSSRPSTNSPAPSPAGATPPPPSPSSATPPPSGSATPPSVSIPPPPNSAASFPGAVTLITFLAVALALFY